ncbi:MAG: Uma2 family endonuclease, partial [Bryobacteraceae bacterium]
MSVHTVLTVDEFSKLPEPKEGHIELHHGEVLLVSPPKRGHQRIQRRLSALITGLTQGVVEMEMAFRPLPDYEVWQADIGYISLDRELATP